jgi:3-phosphoshikimate 1-carboxyvinyltransferase
VQLSSGPLSERCSIMPGQPLQGTLRLPGSKYYTARYILAAALADGESMVCNPALSDDTDVLVQALTELGAQFRYGIGRAPGQQYGKELAPIGEGQEVVLRIKGTGGRLVVPASGEINAGNAGAVLRLLLGVGATLPEVRFTTPFPESLGRRPNVDLLDALVQLGAEAKAKGPNGELPITLRGGRLHGGHVRISGARSSQYLSALLFLAPLIGEDVAIERVDELHSAPLVHITLRVLTEAGIAVEHDAELRHFFIPGGQQYQPRDYLVPGDYPSAATWLAAGAIAGGEVTLLGLRDRTPQPLCHKSGECGRTAAEDRDGDASERSLLQAFGSMGVRMEWRDDGALVVRGGAPLRGIRFDGDRVIDSVPALVAAACFAGGETHITNVATLHYKESDRIVDLCAELRRVGGAVTPGTDSITVQGQPEGLEGGTTVDGHQDHRLIMALSVVALRCRRGLTITGAQHVSKSYPTFFTELARLGARVAFDAPLNGALQ